MAHDLKQLIITADDLGFSESVNAGILIAAKKKRLSCASVMVGMPYVGEALRMVAEEAPWLGLGLHVCLTSGRALSSPQDIPILVHSDGCFKLSFIGLWRVLHTGPEKKRREAAFQVELEVKAQYERFLNLTQKFSLCLGHLDSHQHIHVIPGVSDVILKILSRWCEDNNVFMPDERSDMLNWNRCEVYDNNVLIPDEMYHEVSGRCNRNNTVRLRIPDEPYLGLGRFLSRIGAWFPAGIAKRFLLRYFIRKSFLTDVHLMTDKYEKKRLETPCYFGILDSGKMTWRAWRAILKNWPDGLTAEVNLHPSVSGNLSAQCVCSSADRVFHLSPMRQRELEVLCSDRWKDLCVRSGVSLKVHGEN